jgi:cholest-4-en-3-one 26-monooxygenase
MPTTVSKPNLSIFDPDTYANGDPATFGLPLDQYRYLREEEPCYLQDFGGDPLLLPRVWVVSRHADIETVDKNPDTWAADKGRVNIWSFAPIGDQVDKPSMLTSDGEKHRAGRKTVSKFFRPTVFEKLEPKFRAYARDVVDAALAKGEPFNFVEDVAHVMPMQALGDVLGVPEPDRPKFFNWVDTFAAPFDTRVTPSFENVGQAIMALYEYALELAELKRKEPGDDVMSAMVAGQNGDQMPDNEIQGNVTLLASGAAESTRTSLSHGMHELMRNPEQMAWIRERADDIPPTVAQEIVRISSPFTHLVRTARADTEIAGQEVKEGEDVAMLFAAGNFDTDVFDGPEKFDLSRDPNPHLSFGRGPHSCMGKHIAALEIKILLEELLQRTKEIKPAGEISYVRDAYSRGVYELPVELIQA